MTKMKSTKHALVASFLVLVMCISMLVGSTFAWFTDSVTSGSNKIVAGNLKIDLELLDAETQKWNSIKETKAPIFNYDKWEPGYTDVKILKVENEGSLALKWYAKFISANEIGELAKVIDVYVCPSETTELTYPATRDLTGYTHVGTLDKFIDTLSTTTYGHLAAGKSAYLGIALKMQETAGNYYQGKTLGAFDIMILAAQDTVESDSFNNQYDKDADYIPAVNSLAELRTALTNGGEYKLAADINVSSTELLYRADGGHKDGSAFLIKADTVLDLNGHNITIDAPSHVADVFFVNGGHNFTVKGNGTVTADCGIFVAYDSATTINIEGGNYKCTANNDMLYAIWGKLNVSGGTYETAYWNLINIYGQGNISLVDVSGGSFKNWNPASSPDGNLLADGYKSVQVDGYYYVVPAEVDAVATTATNFKNAINNAASGDTVALGTDIEIPTGAPFLINKDIVLDLNGQTLTSNASYGGIQAKGGLSIKNGTFNYTQTNAAIKVWNMKSIEDVTIICTPQAGKTIGGIVVQNQEGNHIDTIKNVTIIGATNGIECYRSTNEPAIGSMENVKIEATQNGIWLNGAGCIGSITDCNIYGEDIGINAYLANLWHISLDIKNSKISGGRHGIDIWDEAKTNTGSSVNFNYDDTTTFTGGTWDIKVTLQDEITCTINNEVQTSPCEIYVKN